LGKTVAAMDGAMYCQYRKVNVMQCMPLNEGTSAREGASFFVNPLTALGFVETMKMEGHKAIVHTAAASNLGQMLNKLCIKDGIELVNIVRREEQAELLRALGAKYVCNSSSESFTEDLIDAIAETGAYLAFDAIGGGSMGSQILNCMERAALRTSEANGPYGTTIHKQLYVYGRLNTAQLELNLGMGFRYALAGWLMPMFLEKVGAERAQQLRQRIADEITTTFASSYTKEVSLSQVMDAEFVAEFSKMATGTKYLINPTLDT
jgi:NADPH2:quinone reductase